jgi:hypothetical protein
LKFKRRENKYLWYIEIVKYNLVVRQRKSLRTPWFSGLDVTSPLNDFFLDTWAYVPEGVCIVHHYFVSDLQVFKRVQRKFTSWYL